MAGSGENRPKSSDLSEKLDIYSEKFDPLAFLLSDKSNIPRPDAKTYDNLAMWRSNYEGRGSREKKDKNAAKMTVPARKWLPHQLPVQSKKPSRIQKNVFTRMEAIQGPLAVLRKYTAEKTRIKVVTRNEKGVRGYCIANLLAFDRHFNLVLDDIEEVWTRSIKIKTHPILLDVSSDGQSPQQGSKNRVRIPRISTRKISKNTEECRRHVDQMLLRGEHVVLICVAVENRLTEEQKT